MLLENLVELVNVRKEFGNNVRSGEVDSAIRGMGFRKIAEHPQHSLILIESMRGADWDLLNEETRNKVYKGLTDISFAIFSNEPKRAQERYKKLKSEVEG